MNTVTTGRTPFAPDTLIATAGGIPLPRPDLFGNPLPLRALVAKTLAPEPLERPHAHELLEQLLKAGADGDAVIRASLDNSPDLKRAAAAVWPTAPFEPAAARRLASPANLWRTYARRRPAKAAAVVAIAALLAGFGAYPATNRLVLDRENNPQPSIAQPDISDRDGADDEKASRANRRERCTLDGPLEVTTHNAKPYTCPEAKSAGQQTIRTRVKVSTPDACAAVWAHVSGDDAYRIAVCENQLALDRVRQGQTQRIEAIPIDPPADDGWRQLEIVTPDQGVVVTLDNEQVISQTRLAWQPRRGAVVLGIIMTAKSPARPTVLFTDVSVTTGT